LKSTANEILNSLCYNFRYLSSNIKQLNVLKLNIENSDFNFNKETFDRIRGLKANNIQL